MRARGTPAVALAAALVALASPGVAATTRALSCDVLAFSPDFGRDRTMFCLTTRNGSALLYRSMNGGERWAPGRVVVTDGVKSATGIVVSPLFARDQRVWVSTPSGLYQSNDRGTTFVKASGAGAPPANAMAPYVETLSTSPGARPHAAFAVAEANVFGARVYDSELGSRTVPGAPMFNTRFIVPPDYATTRQAVVIASQMGVYREDESIVPDLPGYGAYLCVGDFACPHRSTYFGDIDGSHFGALGLPGNYYFGGHDSKPYYSRPRPPRLRISAFRTRDYGRTWQRWPSLANLLHREDAKDYSIAASPDAPGRLFLHMTLDSERTKSKRPGTQLYRSDDDGANWRRIGFAWEPGQRATAQPTLPWNFMPIMGYAEPTVFTHSGRLYVLGEHRTGKTTHFRGMYCSTDLGRTWRRATCAPGGTEGRVASRP